MKLKICFVANKATYFFFRYIVNKNVNCLSFIIKKLASINFILNSTYSTLLDRVVKSKRLIMNAVQI